MAKEAMTPAQQRLQAAHAAESLLNRAIHRPFSGMVVIGTLCALFLGGVLVVAAPDAPQRVARILVITSLLVPMWVVALYGPIRHRRARRALAHIEADPPPRAQWHAMLSTRREQTQRRARQLRHDGWLLTPAGLLSALCVFLPMAAPLTVWIGSAGSVGAVIWWLLRYWQTERDAAQYAAFAAYYDFDNRS